MSELTPVTGTPAVQFGSASNIPQGTRRQWAPETGERQEYLWRGLAQALAVLYESLKVDASTDPTFEGLSFDPGKGVGELRAVRRQTSIGVPQSRQPIYEMWVNYMQEPIENHPRYASLTEAQIAEVLRAYDEYEDADSAWSALELELFKFLVRGKHTYDGEMYVIRRTEYDLREGSVIARCHNVGRVDPAPPDISALNPIVGSLPTCEWLKKAPQVRRDANRMFSVEQEWWGVPSASGGGWSAALYGGTRVP